MKGYIIAGIVVITVAIGGGYYWYRTSNAPKYITAKVIKGSITEEVSARGNVTPPETINLQFQNSGKINLFKVRVGSKVKAGDVLVRQDTSVLKAELRQAQAVVNTNEAQLKSLKEGTRQEQIAVTEAQVKSDQVAVSQANQNMIYAIQSAYTYSDDAIHNKIDQFINNPRSATPTFVVTTSNTEAANRALTKRISIEEMLSSWRTNVSILSNVGSDLINFGMDAQNNLAFISQFLSDINLVLNSSVQTATESQATLNTWMSNTATARTNIDTSISSLNTSITNLRNNLATLEKDQKNLLLEKAGPTKVSIEEQESRIAQAKARVSAIEAQLKQMEIIAPVDGTVTQINGNVGEVITPLVVAVSIIPTVKLQVDVNVSEENIGKVKLGDKVQIDLTSFPSIKWKGTVVQINPAHTIVSGAIYYKTKIILDEQDERIKTGMTANVLIEIGTATSTLIVPASALETNNVNTSVKIYKNGKVLDRNVTTGLRSQDGMIEIVSGLSIGDDVIIGTE